MTLADTSFEDAKKIFTVFLADNGMDARILWVFREDVYSRRTDKFETDFWLKLPLPSENEKLAKHHFEFGKRKGFGLALTAFASCDEGLCCSFVVPTDDEDAQYMLMGPQHLKYSFVSRDMPAAKVVCSKLLWKLFRFLPWWFQSGNHFVYLESKSELRAPADQ